MRFIYLLFLSILFLIYCQTCPDSLEEIKQYQPDDEYFKASMKNLHFIIESSPVSEVDSTFDKMFHYYKLPVDAKNCEDGIYIGESPYDAYDYRHVVKLEIRNKKIIQVDYNEINRSGENKENDPVYNKKMSISGTTPAEAYPVYERELRKKQNLIEVSAITGATYSLYRFKYAVTIALMKARLAKN